jgi:hypothetical protein
LSQAPIFRNSSAARDRISPAPAQGGIHRGVDNLHTGAKRQLTKRAGSLRSPREIELKRSLGHALGWVELSTR